MIWDAAAIAQFVRASMTPRLDVRQWLLDLPDHAPQRITRQQIQAIRGPIWFGPPPVYGRIAQLFANAEARSELATMFARLREIGPAAVIVSATKREAEVMRSRLTALRGQGLIERLPEIRHDDRIEEGRALIWDSRLPYPIRTIEREETADAGT